MQSPEAEAVLLGMERLKLEKEIEKNGKRRYFVFFNDSDVHQFHAYIVAPDTGLYRFKLVKVHVWLPCHFPCDPPRVKFIHNTMHFVLPNCFPRGNSFSRLYRYVTIGCSLSRSCPLLCQAARNLSTRASRIPISPALVH